jgi:GntR family transcriptional regulator, transcriptional repressor for pyruvate dehydrogenase complex
MTATHTQLFAEVPRSSAPEAVEDQIKSLIVSRQLTAGDVLPPERQFAERLRVSRSTLREALRALAQEGLLSARHGSGWAVAPNATTAASNVSVYFLLEEATLEEILEAELTIEPSIARLAAERRTDSDLESMKGFYDRMRRTDSAAEFVALDYEFHSLIATAAGNLLLSFSMLSTKSLLEELRVSLSARRGAINASQREHARILSAIEARDGEAAEQAMRAHVEGFRRRALRE